MKHPVDPFYKIEGVVKEYDWGGEEFLSTFLSRPNPGKKPMAEYWLGAHPSSSSLIWIEGRKQSLKEFIANDPGNLLGNKVARKFHNLPFLLKVLDVNNMLSIQVHPSKHEAEIEFARENAEEIPLTSSNRNYKDDNHKPELMVALDDFWLLHGFKPAEELVKTLDSIPEFAKLKKIFLDAGYDQLYKTVMEMPQETVNEILKPLLDRNILHYQNQQLNKREENYWATKAALNFNTGDKIDRGIFSIYFFNLLHLKKGEGIFQDAGLPHSYLEGKNIEIMANSDNVLRGGLTTKHIDVKELMKHIKFEETIPQVIPATTSREQFFITAAPDFKLIRYNLGLQDEIKFDTHAAEIILIWNGCVDFSSSTQRVTLNRGESLFVTPGHTIMIHSDEPAVIFRATVPVHSGE